MFESYWGLSASPFANRPDTRWFHESPVHEEALARLFYLIEQRRGLGVLSGDAGLGKTLLLRVLAEQVRRTRRQLALVDAIGLDGHELLWQTATAMHLAPAESASRWTLWRMIADHIESLQLSHAQIVFVFDHVDRCDTSCHTFLERLIGFTQAHGSGTFLLSARSEQLSRIETLVESTELVVELTPLGRPEAEGHVGELLRRAGRNQPCFTPQAIDRLHAASGGNPRRINRLCELSLIAAMGDRRLEVDGELVDSVATGLVATPNLSTTTPRHHVFV